MSETFALVQRLVAAGEVRISEHGYDELTEDGISASEVLFWRDESDTEAQDEVHP